MNDAVINSSVLSTGIKHIIPLLGSESNLLQLPTERILFNICNLDLLSFIGVLFKFVNILFNSVLFQNKNSVFQIFFILLNINIGIIRIITNSKL